VFDTHAMADEQQTAPTGYIRYSGSVIGVEG
jgi:hypothetical protein